MKGSRKTQLYDLIAKMTPSEKRYFKLNSHWKASDKHYLNLFECLEKQKVFDEQLVEKYMAERAFRGQLHVCKNYLLQLLLKSLRNYHSKLSVDAELKNRVRNIEILYRKELYKHCFEEITRAEKMAKDYQNQLMLLDILSWKRRVLLSWKPEQLDDIRALLREEQELLVAYREMQEYWDLMVNSQALSREEAKQKLEHPLLREGKENEHLQARVFADQIRYQLQIMSGGGANAAIILQELLAHIEQFPHRIKESPGAYINTLNNLLSYHVYNKDYKEVHHLLDKIKSVAERFGIVKKDKLFLKLQLRSYNIELEMYRDQKALDKANRLIEELEQFFSKSKKNIPDSYRLLFWFQIANIYFMQGDFSGALKQVNLLLQARFRNLRPDLDLYTRWLNLLIHLEMKNDMVLRYYIDSVKRFAKKRGQMDAQEKRLLQFISEQSLLEEKEQLQAFRELYHDLFEKQYDKSHQNALDYLDIKSWLEQKPGVV